MNAVMLLIVSLQATPAIAADPAVDRSKEIVVTGRRLDTTEKAWRACMARNCPPNEEVDAALAHAENLFVAGDYRKARRTLLDSIGHVDRYAKQYPVAVADIWRAEARIAAHLGEKDPMRIGQLESVDALKAGLPEGDARILYQRLEIADTFVKQDKVSGAVTMYEQVARDAKRRGIDSVRGAALLRPAILYASLMRQDRDRFAYLTRRYIDAVLDTTEPGLEPYRNAAQLLSAQYAALRGDDGELDRLAARYRVKPTETPMLLFAPPINDPRLSGGARQKSTVENRTAADFEGQWADVTFMIGGDGFVKDVDMLRESPSRRPDWLAPVMAAIGRRRYAPLALQPGQEGVRRVERYTLTSFLDVGVGSRIRTRTDPRVEMLDLTADTAVKPVS